jgi:hypothetical protein
MAYVRAQQDVNVPHERGPAAGHACADELYLLEPNDRNAQMLVAAYSQVGLDLRTLRLRVAQNEGRIKNNQWA